MRDLRIFGALGWRRTAYRLLVGAAVSLMLATGAQAATDTGAEDILPPVAHADRDGDGLSDALQNKIAGKAAGKKIAVVVIFNGPGNAASVSAAVGPFAVKRVFTTIRGFAATMTVGQARSLTATPGIFRVEEDLVATINMAEARADYGANAAQASGYDGSGVAVCIVDTGLSGDHVDFAGKIDGFCNTLNGGCTVDATTGMATDDTAPFDDHSHGTHVGGIAAGAGIGQSQYRGVAPAARLYGAKVCNGDGQCIESDIVAGIGWCAGQGAVRVINISIGFSGNGDGNSATSLAADCAVDQSSHPDTCTDYPLRTPKIVVVAAGNAGPGKNTVGEPGAAKEVIGVGALGSASVIEEWADRRGHGVVAFSSRGPTVDGRIKPDITAPGAGITAPDAATTNGYKEFSGTSMASPFTAGTMALMIQARLQSMSRPSTDPLDAADVLALKNALYGTAQDRGPADGPAGKDIDWGHGSIDVNNAVRAAAGLSSVPNTFATTEFFTPLIADGSDWIHPINVTAADVGKSLLVTILNPSEIECLLWVGSDCWILGVSTTDFDVELFDPNGNLIDMSTCFGGEDPNSGLHDPNDPTWTYCGVSGEGRQETLYTTTDTVGEYSLRIYPWNGDGFDEVPSATPEVVIALSGTAGVPDTTAPIVTAGGDQTGDEGAMIGVSATFTDATAGDTHSATIDWGDGTSNTIINPAASPLASSHDYADNGSYTVTVTVTDATGNSGSATLAVTVDNVAPAVNAGADATANAGIPVTINPTFTDPGSADTHSAFVFWGDDTSESINPATSPLSLDHTYADTGTYTVSVTVTDDDGDANFDMLSVTVNPAGSDLPPTVTAPADVTVEATALLTPVSLDTATATDPEDGPLTVSNDAPASDYPVGTTVVTWSATDSAGNTDTDTQNVTVTDTTAPTVTAPADITVASPDALTSVTLGTATAEDIVDGTLTVSNDAPADGFPVGTTQVTWSAIDAAGNTGTDTQNVTVTSTTNTSPVADAGPDQGITLLKRTKTADVTLYGGGSDDPDGSIDSYAWTWDGGSASVVNPLVNLPAGVTIITLTVTDNDGATDTDTVCIDVYRKNPSGTCGSGGPDNTAPVVTITAPADGTSFASGADITFTGSASDAEDVDVTSSLVWTSSIDGTIGTTGGSFSTTTLSDGNHTITATATDGDNATGNQTVDITIGSGGGGGTVSVASITFSVKGKGLTGTVTVDPAVSAVGVRVNFCRPGACLFSNITEATNGKGKANFKIVGFLPSATYTLTVLGLTYNGPECTTGSCTAESSYGP